VGAAFLLAFLAGAAAIAAAVHLSLDLPWTVGLPIAVMALYLLGALVGRRPGSPVEPFADGVFQLGFLFTVTALLAALSPYALAGAPPTVETILGLFAVASTTTVFGLVGRVCLRQFVPAADMVEADADPALVERTRALGEALDAATERFQGTAATLDAFGATMATLQDRTARTLETLSGETRDLAAELKTVREAAARNEERIARIFDSYEMMIAKLREAQQAGDRFQEALGQRTADLVGALEAAAGTVGSLAGDGKAAIGGLGSEVDGVREARAALAADAAAIAEIRAKLGEQLNAAIDRSTASPRPGGEDEALTIDEDAFSEIDPAADEDEVFIPPLRGRLSRPGGPA
ncbi:MAG: hypothetical protein HKM95_00005, partial [Inquilinus sp.]|nr:hypothetical protein [Inquilinus sp.]